MKNVLGKLNKLFIPGKSNDFKPHILEPKNLFKLAIILLVIKFLIFSWFFYFPKTSNFAVVTSSELIEMANKDRIAAGLKPLVINEKLVEAAQNKAQDMLSNDYFAHFSPLGVSPWHWIEKSGYKYTAAGENLAKDFTDSIYVQKAWMNSSSHRANILNANYQEIGIAVVEGKINGETTVLAVEIFGKPTASAVTKPTPTTPVATNTKPAVTNNKTNTSTAPEVKSGVSTEPIVAVESSNVKGEETVSLKGPSVFKQRGVFGGIVEKASNIINQEIYFIILGIISVILMLTIFINIKVQHPKIILTVLIFIILIAAIALFNGKEFLNSGISII